MTAETELFFKNSIITLIVLIAIIVIILIIAIAYMGSTVQKVNTILNPLVTISTEISDFMSENKGTIDEFYKNIKEVAKQELKVAGPAIKGMFSQLTSLARDGINLGLQTASFELNQAQTNLNAQKIQQENAKKIA